MSAKGGRRGRSGVRTNAMGRSAGRGLVLVAPGAVPGAGAALPSGRICSSSARGDTGCHGTYACMHVLGALRILSPLAMRRCDVKNSRPTSCRPSAALRQPDDEP